MRAMEPKKIDWSETLSEYARWDEAIPDPVHKIFNGSLEPEDLQFIDPDSLREFMEYLHRQGD